MPQDANQKADQNSAKQREKSPQPAVAPRECRLFKQKERGISEHHADKNRHAERKRKPEKRGGNHMAVGMCKKFRERSQNAILRTPVRYAGGGDDHEKQKR